MQKTFHLFVACAAIIFGALSASAQTKATPQRECAAHDKFVQMMGLPSFEARQHQLEAQTATFIQNLQAARAAGQADAAVVITIPVVFHIVYSNDQQNIPDSKIFEQVQILTDDFRYLNDNQDAEWAQAADTEIEFCLATRDPNGAPTDGILRVATTSGSFGTSDNIKFTASGGSDAWPASDYLNFWVGDLGGGLLGYAQFPGGAAATDGIVCAYPNVGLNGPGAGIYNLGRTATHEVGHWLNLRHIWGDGGCGVDDFVADTPESDGANYNCDLGSSSCGSVDMVQNYMDYSSDLCMNLFTQGQSDRMAATFAPGGARHSLLSSMGCVPATPDFDLDASILNVISPSGFFCATDVIPEITIFNNGGDVLTSLDITYALSGTEVGTETWTGSLEFGQTAVFALPTLTPGDGAHAFTASCSNANGGTDENASNDSGSSDFNMDSQGIDLELTINLDEWSGETSWDLTSATGVVVWSGGPYSSPSATVAESTCVPSDCYTFTMYDVFGDGICCGLFGDGSYTLVSNSDTLAAGGQFDFSDATGFCFGDGVSACMDPEACNYDPDAIVDDGNCDYSCIGCTNELACNYNPDATVDDGSCIFPEDGVDCVCVTLAIDLDNWGDETTWDITDGSGAVIWSGGPYAGETDFTETTCMEDGCYTLTMYDAFGDGICCYWGSGDYELSSGGVVLASGGEFGDSESTVFCLGDGPFGCMDAAACNYDADAVTDDFGCDYSCTGCMDAAACNYDADATIDDGDCIYPDADGLCACLELTLITDDWAAETTWALTDANDSTIWSGGPYNDFDTVNVEFCPGAGCYDFTIYDAFGDGICCLYGTGSYTLVAGNDTLAAGGEFGSEETTILCFGDFTAGCTESGACNFDAEADLNDGSCDYSCTGCTNDLACNYDPDATLDDGSCIFVDPGEVCACLEITILTDNYPGETTWELTDMDGTSIWSGGPYENQAETIIANFCPGAGCYTFSIYDSFGDGICCNYGTGDFSLVSIDGDTLAAGGSFGASDVTVFCLGDGLVGCTDSAACNFDAEATMDDNSCDYSCTGCTDPEACNYDADATIDDGSCIYPDPGLDCNCTVLTILTDNYPGEITWAVTDFNGDVVWSGGPYSNANSSYVESGCLDNGCYTLTMYDSFGDGICCSFGEGNYTLNSMGITLASGGAYADMDVTEFCIGGDISGCTDEVACNYNPFATTDDGSCYYIDDEYYDCDGNCYNDLDGDGVCDGNEVAGCTDPEAVNYNPDATDDDGSCTDEEPGSFTELTYELVGYNTVGTMETYRVYANFTDPTDQLVAVFGYDEYPLQADVTTGFYQNELGGATPALVNPALFDAFPDLQYDSWITVGGEDNTADINQVGIDFTDFEAGNNLVINNVTGGSVFIYPDLEPTAYPDAEGRVLIGQFTTDGEVELLMNIQYRTAIGGNPQATGLTLLFPDTPPCIGDWNNDGIISVSDMLLVLSEFGCAEGCNYDMSGDGGVTTSDILQMLALFGSSCPE